jgi:protocatechuate 3,4-dioxygenase beta subunit
MRARLRSRTFVVGFFALASAIAAAQALPQQPQTPAQTPPKGTGILLGQVIDAQDKRPIAGALVTLGGEVPVPQSTAPITDAPRQILTDGSGRFMFRSLAAGRYQVRATAGSYISAGLGQNRPSGAPQSVELTTDDEKRDGLLVRMWKNASISGTVTDEAGEAVIGYSVRLLRRTATSRGVRYSTGNTVSTDRPRILSNIRSPCPGNIS